MRWILTLILIVSLQGCAMATTYYCGVGQAQTTIAEVNALSPSSGDTISFNKGEIFNDVQLNCVSGVTYNSYGIGDKPLFNASSYQQNIMASSKSNIIIDGLQFSGGIADQKLIYIVRCDNVTIKNCDFTGNIPQWAIYFYSDATRNMYNNKVEDCTFDGAGYNDSIRFGCFNSSGSSIPNTFEVSGCTFTNVSRYGIRFYVTQNCVNAGFEPTDILINNNTFTDTGHAAIIIDSAMDITISNNTLTNIGAVDQDNVNAIQTNNCNGLIIQNNTVDTVNTSLPDGCAIILDWGFTDNDYLTENAVIRNNLIIGCNANNETPAISAFKGRNSQIYNNIIYDCGMGLVNVNPESTGNVFYNNTIYNVQTYAMMIGNDYGNRYSPECTVKNNIFHTATHGIVIRNANSTLPVEDYNCFYNISTGYEVYDKRPNPDIELSIGTHSIIASPLLNSDYTLQAGSPCIDAGAALPEVVDIDYAGNMRPIGAGWDMGAYEWWNTRIRNAELKNCVIK